MKFQSLIRYAIMVLASALVAACGGGAATNPNQGGPIQVAPLVGTFFAGVPSTITISGGRIPYSITSSAPQILPVPDQVNEHSFQVVPNNPAVFTSAAGAVPPTFDVTISVRSADSGGDPISIIIHVAQNFLTGYNVTFTTNCPSGQACAGGQTAVTLQDALNGSLTGGRTFRFIALRGPFSWVFPNGAKGSTIDLIADHTGSTRAILQVDTGVSSQLAVFRLQDVGTGVYADYVFTISGSVTPQTLTALPSSFDFKAALKGVCGTGAGDFYVFDGTPPYKAISADPQHLWVTVPGTTATGPGPVTSSTQPGAFEVVAFDPNFCLNPGTVVITDANNGRVTVDMKTEEGSGTPPPPPLNVSPSSITLSCGQTGSVTVVGGTGSASASSTDPNLTVAGSGSSVSIKRNGALPVLPGGNQTTTVNVTDGTSIFPVSVTSPVNCS